MSRKKIESPKEQRIELLYEMCPATRKVAREIEEKLRDAELVSTLAHYDVGKRMAEVVRQEEVFGASAIRQIACFLSIPGGTRLLYDLRQFAKEFTRYYVEDEASRTLDNGRPFSLEHFLVLMRVRSKREHQRLIEQVRAEGLKPRQLQREIRAN